MLEAIYLWMIGLEMRMNFDNSGTTQILGSTQSCFALEECRHQDIAKRALERSI